MNEAYLLIGGNIGSREQNLEAARTLIGKYCGNIKKASAIYETAPWGKADQPAFLNQAVYVETLSDPIQLIRVIAKIEKQMGRVRKEKLGPRLIDIDILLFNQQVIDHPFLKIPHPELANRRFALVPLAEIAADMHHPVLNKSIRQLLKECTDDLEVTRHD